MASIDSSVLEEVRARIDLVDLIREYGVDLKRQGNNAKACCPFHKEKTPSFSVNGTKGFYKCFGCGEHGDAFTFVQKMEGVTFMEAIRKLAKRAGVEIVERYDPRAKVRARLYQINRELAAFYQRCLLQTREAQAARDYLASRDLTGAIAEQFAIGYAPEGKDTLLRWAEKHNFAPDELVAAGLLVPPKYARDTYYDRFHGRITFPICDPQGRVIAFSCRLLKKQDNAGKYVNSPETEIFKKANTLYAFHLARAHIAKAVPRRAIVCEGQIDVIRCHACGFPTAVASQGTAFTEEHVTILKRCADSADLVFDGDKAGIKAALRTMALFMNAGMPVRIVSLPPGEDPDSLLRTQGSEAFRACLDAAEDPAPYLVRRMREAEATPDAMDAVMRIAKAAVLNVLSCPEPVLTAKFLQDVADALHLPVSTLEHDLETLRTNAAAAEQRRNEFLARQAGQNGTAAPAHEESPEAPEEVPIEDFVPEEEEYPEDFVEPAFPRDVVDLEASSNLAGALCELLAYHFTEPDVMGCLIRHLPPAFVHNPYAAKLYDLAIAASLAGDTHLEPPKDDPDFTQMLARLCAEPDRVVAGGDEDTPLTFARDLVRHYWLREFERRAKQLPPDSLEYLQLVQSRKRLQTLPWERAEVYMNAMDPKFTALRPETPAPAKHVAPPPPLPNEQPELATAEPMEWLPSDEDEGDPYGAL